MLEENSTCSTEASFEDRYKRFRRLLIANQDLNQCLPCGSFCELPLGYVLSNITDIDALYWSTKAVACQPNDAIHLKGNRKNSIMLMIESKDCHVGFVRLRRLRTDASGSCYSEFFRRPNMSKDGYVSKGPSLTKIIVADEEKLVLLIAFYIKHWKYGNRVSIDNVYAVQCPHWPSQATEWVTRERKNNWPSVTDLNAIVNAGCHLVSKPHHSSGNDDTQWRFSFSQAELRLIHSWCSVQKYVYHLLRLIKSEVVRRSGGEEQSCLCTYHFKTLMLWACEEKPSSFWKEENLETSIGELLCKMIEWLIDRSCPNYFIRGNNMMDHLPTGVDITDINILLHIRLHELPLFLSKVPEICSRKSVSINISSNLLDYLQLKLQRVYVVHVFQPKSVKSSLSRFLASDEFAPELRQLFEGLTLQLHFMTMLNRGNNPPQSQAVCALKCWDVAEKAIVSGSASVSMDSYSDSSISEFVYQLATFNQYESHTSTRNKVRAQNLRPDETKGVFSTSQPGEEPYFTQSDSSNESVERFLSDRETGIVGECQKVAVRNNENMFMEKIKKYLEEAMSTFPPPTYFVTTAYKANFYYNTLHDHSLAFCFSSKVIDYIGHLQTSLLYDKDFTMAFPMLLSNDLSLLFDRYIQVVLGFVTLFRGVSSGNEDNKCRLTVIQLCPREFLRYVRFQSARLHDSQTTVFYICSFVEVLRTWIVYQQCFDSLSAVLLLTAIRISGVEVQRHEGTYLRATWPA